MTIDIKLEEFLVWFQDQLDCKYGQQIENLKRVVLVFYNLAGQIIDIYFSMGQKLKSSFLASLQIRSSQYFQATRILEKSLYILNSMADAEKYPRCLDSNFCQKFGRLFQQNLNLLCTLYHSFSHMQLSLGSNIKVQRQKIVEGINKLYGLHAKIKEYAKTHSNILKQIYDQKKLFAEKVSSIQQKITDYKQRDIVFDSFEQHAVQFYNSLQQSIKKVSNEPEPIRNFMKCYFTLLHELYSTQARLQTLLDGPMMICQDIKNKKRKNSFGSQEALSQYSKWVNSLLKPSSSVKNTKKIKVEEFMKYTANLLKDRQYFTDPALIPSLQEIQESVNLLIEMMKQYDKVEQSGLLNVIGEYKESLLPQNTKKMVIRLIDYQMHMARFYHLHQEAKELQKVIQVIVMQEFGTKVNIVIDYQLAQ